MIFYKGHLMLFYFENIRFRLYINDGKLLQNEF